MKLYGHLKQKCLPNKTDARIVSRPIGPAVSALFHEAGGLWFISQAGQIGPSVANGWSTMQYFFAGTCVARTHNTAEIGPTNLLHASVYYCKCNEKYEFRTVVLNLF